MERVIATAQDQNGNTFNSDFILQGEDGIYCRQSVNCWSSADLDLGTCRCQSHDPWRVTPLTLDECANYGISLPASDLFKQRLALLGLTIPDLEEFCRLSYRMDCNPLPRLRKLFPELSVNFMFQDDSRKSYWGWEDSDGPTMVVELCDQRDQNGDLTVWIVTYF